MSLTSHWSQTLLNSATLHQAIEQNNLEQIRAYLKEQTLTQHDYNACLYFFAEKTAHVPEHLQQGYHTLLTVFIEQGADISVILQQIEKHAGQQPMLPLLNSLQQAVTQGMIRYQDQNDQQQFKQIFTTAATALQYTFTNLEQAKHVVPHKTIAHYQRKLFTLMSHVTHQSIAPVSHVVKRVKQGMSDYFTKPPLQQDKHHIKQWIRSKLTRIKQRLQRR